MKYLLTMLGCCLMFAHAYAQNGIMVRDDSISIRNSELIIENSTRAVPGVLHNNGNGRTSFQRLHLKNLGDTAIAITGHDTVRFNGGRPGGTISELPLWLAVSAINSTQQRLWWWKSPSDFYTAPRIGVIGASQGKGAYSSTYAMSIIGRLTTYVSQVSSNPQVTNYCESGYNSRQLMPTGANQWVDVNRNITKALADGNKIIILVTPTNDFSSGTSGGMLQVYESVANIAVIEDACTRAGAAFFVFDGFPRNDYSAAQREMLSQLGDILRRKYGPRCAKAYKLVEDPSTPFRLNPALHMGDNIHLNDQGALIAYQPIRDVLTAYYASNTGIAKYVLQRTASLNGTFADFYTVNQSGVDNTTYDLPQDANFYRVRYFSHDGTFSSWSNIVQGTGNISGDLPSVNAGPDQSVGLPASVTLSATTTSTVTSYQWTKVSGGTASITSPASAVTTVTGLVAGTYVFRCTVTNSQGLQAHDDVQITVTTSAAQKIARFNFSAASRPVNGYNNVAGHPHISILSAIDAQTGIGLNTVATNAWIPNGAESSRDGFAVTNSGGFIVDSLALANVAFTGSKTAVDNIQITGLTAGSRCKILVTANAVSSPRITMVSINGDVQQYNATNNSSQAAIFDNLLIPPGGTINIAMYASAASAFGVVSAVLVEEFPASQPLTVNAGADQSVVFPANVTLQATAQNSEGTITGYSWTKVSGGAATIQSPGTTSTTVTGLEVGIYVFRCTVTNSVSATASDDVTITVTAGTPPNQPPVVNAGTDQNVVMPATPTFSATASDPDGSIVAYAWELIGGSKGVITSPTSASTTITGYTIGTYTLRCTVTDNSGAQAFDEVQFTVTSTTIARIANFNFSGTANPVPGFVNVYGFPHLAVRSGTSPSGIGVNTISTTVHIPNQDNTAVDDIPMVNDGGGFIVPRLALRSIYFARGNTAVDNMQITGLTPGKYCRILVMANAFSSPRITMVRIAGTTLSFNATQNSSKAAIFDTVLVPAGGTINIAYYAQDASSYAGLISVLIVEEYTN